MKYLKSLKATLIESLTALEYFLCVIVDYACEQMGSASSVSARLITVDLRICLGIDWFSSQGEQAFH